MPHNKKSTKQVFSSVLPYSNDSYEVFQKLIASSKPFVSCFGTYTVFLKGHKGSITIEKLCDYVIALLKKNPDFDEKERASGLLITKTIEAFNDKCDRSLKKKNCITQLIVQIMHFINTFLFCQESRWKDTIDNYYTHYTANQFLRKTGKTPQQYYKGKTYPYRIGSVRRDIHHPVRWALREQNVGE